MRTYDLVIVSMLGALAAIFQITHGVLGIPTGFGMTVDLVAVPVLLAFFLFGLEHSLWVLLIASLVITVIAPDSWLGASMKFSATLPMLTLPALYLISKGSKAAFFFFCVISLIIGLAVIMLSGSVGLLVKPVFAGLPLEHLALGLAPILSIAFLSLVILALWKPAAKKISPKPLSKPAIAIAVLLAALAVRALVATISNYYYAGPIFFGMPPEKLMQLAPWFAIAGWNALQGILEFGIAWTLAYPFGFAKRYGKWRDG